MIMCLKIDRYSLLGHHTPQGGTENSTLGESTYSFKRVITMDGVYPAFAGAKSCQLRIPGL